MAVMGLVQSPIFPVIGLNYIGVGLYLVRGGAPVVEFSVSERSVVSLPAPVAQSFRGRATGRGGMKRKSISYWRGVTEERGSIDYAHFPQMHGVECTASPLGSRKRRRLRVTLGKLGAIIFSRGESGRGGMGALELRVTIRIRLYRLGRKYCNLEP